MKYSVKTFVCATWPMMLYGIIYFSLGWLPHSHSIDTEGLYNLERSLFGITAEGMTAIDGGETITFAEYFSQHHWAWADVVSGLCYICWVPLPIIFTLYLYIKGMHRHCLCFTLTFLTMNIIGFAIAAVHPAAAPWYVMEHGFEALPETASNAAGLLRFDEMMGMRIFETIYKGSTNVFGAFPSLHAAKVSMVCLYAVLLFERERRPSLFVWATITLFVTFGTWLGAVYTAHHYIVDVVAGILCVGAAYLLFAYVIRRTRLFKRLDAQLKN